VPPRAALFGATSGRWPGLCLQTADDLPRHRPRAKGAREATLTNGPLGPPDPRRYLDPCTEPVLTQ
jgi:hypothetical protein